MSVTRSSVKRVAILGGNGFTGGELYRLLKRHPYFKVDFVSSESKAGLPLDKFFVSSARQKRADGGKFQKLASLSGHYDFIFSCLPTGVLPRHIDHIAEHAEYVINVSGDYRLNDQELLRQYYPESLSHPAQGGSHYFIPEFSDINLEAKVVNLPGCMAVATIYTLFPLLAANLIEPRVISDAKTGSSGGGKASTEHHAERAHNFRPYKVHGHRHRPEIEFALEEHLERSVELQFSVHSLDLPRGILVTSYSLLKEHASEIDVKKAFYGAYAAKPFVHYFNSKNGSYSYPMIKTTAGTNYAEVGAYVEGRNCVSIASIDNLIKGAAGQAIQAANLYSGIAEEAGLQFELEGAWP
ncbi:N-acetyl-gamma-glutamyl-phosphate reductase [Paenibacillus sp. Leaf72]|uniref:N-acetyl-gamma-glutamyl-phosphate reductase n=1 Tax=Paenibacillus sp. Leaf72 TaxID=1736234 RepID=UPI0006FF8FDF|nr:N-acetyl-gamma-glutamyl-phosphate reductase [Paenibacillus sp. Leaf72]KQO04583.1 N-acetyl-gamma-glutamyl-phosphate reductase [Paenibacillus sp. Leaf72]